MPPVKAAALRIARPTIIATLAIVCQTSFDLYIKKAKPLSGVWQDFLFLEVLFERDGAGHDSGELNIVCDVVAGVVCLFFFFIDHLFRNPADAGGQAGQNGGVHDGLHEFVVSHGMNMPEEDFNC